MRSILPVSAAGVLLGLGAGVGHAADLLVPSQYSTISAAIAAAAPNDVVIIQNSATYTEDIVLSKPITVKAALGASPTIRPTGDSSFGVLFTDGGVGAKFGSNDGGRITLSFSNGLGSVNRAIYHQYDVAGTTTVENISMVGAPPGTNLSFFFLYPVVQAGSNIVIRNTTIDATNVQWPIRLTFLRGSVFTLEDCVIDSLPDLPAGSQRAFQVTGTDSNGTVNIRGSVIRGSESAIYVDVNAGPVTWNIENSYLSNIGGAFQSSSMHTVILRSPNQVMNMDYTVIDQTWPVGQTLFFFQGNDQVMNLNHCDVLSLNLGARSDPALRRTFNATNTNFVTTNQEIFFALTAQDVVTLDWNNYNGSGILPEGMINPGENSLGGDIDGEPGIVPSYFSPGAPNYNYGYDNEGLLERSSTGTPIGSFLNGADVPPPSEITDWMVIN